MCAEKPPEVGFKESGDMCKVMLKKKNQFGWGVQKSTEGDIKDRKHDCPTETGTARAKMEWGGAGLPRR